MSSRRRAPGFTLEEAIGLIKQLREARGNGPYAREVVAEGLGHKMVSGSAARKVGALAHFGLLDRADGVYVMSELSKRILTPVADNERQRAIAEAASSPTMYREILERFKDQPLPRQFANILHRDFGVSLKASESSAATFKDTMEFAGLLRNGVLYTQSEQDPDSAHTPTEDPTEQSATHAQPAEQQTVSEHTGGTQRFSIPLSKRRVGSLELPLPLEAQDLARIKGWLDLMGDVLVDEASYDDDDVPTRH